jgi:hypothetical protein
MQDIAQHLMLLYLKPALRAFRVTLELVVAVVVDEPHQLSMQACRFG